jgi:hypothetical protein
MLAIESRWWHYTRAQCRIDFKNLGFQPKHRCQRMAGRTSKSACTRQTVPSADRSHTRNMLYSRPSTPADVQAIGRHPLGACIGSSNRHRGSVPSLQKMLPCNRQRSPRPQVNPEVIDCPANPKIRWLMKISHALEVCRHSSSIGCGSGMASMPSRTING